jgi:hypothetical protein
MDETCNTENGLRNAYILVVEPHLGDLCIDEKIVIILKLMSENYVKVKVPLRPTVSPSVRLGVEPRPGLMTRCYVLLDSYGFVSLAPSLTRGRVCHLS